MERFHGAGIRRRGFGAGDAEVSADSYMARIQQRGTFNVGVKAELLGVCYQNPMTGKFEGFAVDLGADLSERLFGKPAEVTYRPVLGVTRIPMLEQGLIDVIIDTMFIMKERWRQIDFAEPYWGRPPASWSPGPIATSRAQGFEGKRVASTKGSSSERWFRDPTLGYPKVQLVMFDSSLSRSRRSASGELMPPCSTRSSALPR